MIKAIKAPKQVSRHRQGVRSIRRPATKATKQAESLIYGIGLLIGLVMMAVNNF